MYDEIGEFYTYRRQFILQVGLVVTNKLYPTSWTFFVHVLHKSLRAVSIVRSVLEFFNRSDHSSCMTLQNLAPRNTNVLTNMQIEVNNLNVDMLKDNRVAKRNMLNPSRTNANMTIDQRMQRTTLELLIKWELLKINKLLFITAHQLYEYVEL